MSIAPPGYPADEEPVRYEIKSVQVLRSRAGGTKVKWQNQGWEFISEDRGRLRTVLTFRHVKPKTLGSHLVSLGTALRRSQPGLGSFGAFALVAALAVGGFAVATRTGSEPAVPSAARNTMAFVPTAVPVEAAEPVETVESREPVATPRARTGAKVRSRARARTRALQEERRRNTEELAGLTCAEIDRTNIPVTPGSSLDRNSNGIGCER
jgi:hypothetical protein